MLRPLRDMLTPGMPRLLRPLSCGAAAPGSCPATQPSSSGGGRGGGASSPIHPLLYLTQFISYSEWPGLRPTGDTPGTRPAQQSVARRDTCHTSTHNTTPHMRTYLSDASRCFIPPLYPHACLLSEHFFTRVGARFPLLPACLPMHMSQRLVQRLYVNGSHACREE